MEKNNNTKRVVITGLGTVNPLGNNVNDFWGNIVANKHGFSYIDEFDASELGVSVVAKVKDFSTEGIIEPKEAKRMERFIQLAVVSACEALNDAGVGLKEEFVCGDIDPYRAGIIVGCGIGGLELTLRQHDIILTKGPTRTSVFGIPMMIINMVAGEIGIKTGFKGANFATVTACASATHSIGEAFRQIKHGYLDMCICGGTESCLGIFAVSGFANMRALTRSSDLERASIPFDKDRSGFVLGEGAGILVLEEYEHAVKRNAKIYAEVGGYGATCDAYHITSPSPNGEAAAKAMQFAYEEAGLTPQDITYVNAHGTSTPLNDKYETGAIKIALGEHAKNVYINSTKSMLGHLLGAAGGVEAITMALSIKNNFIHKTIGYQTPDPECDLNYCVNENINTPINAALSNSLGFGGHNATILFRDCR